MSDLTTDAMVDAAAEAAYTMAAWDAQNFTGTNWTELDPAHRTPWLREAEAALEAAAPLIAAKAWDEGYAMSERELDHAYGGHPISPDDPSDLCHECGTGNPYRADRIERGES